MNFQLIVLDILFVSFKKVLQKYFYKRYEEILTLHCKWLFYRCWEEWILHHHFDKTSQICIVNIQNVSQLRQYRDLSITKVCKNFQPISGTLQNIGIVKSSMLTLEFLSFGFQKISQYLELFSHYIKRLEESVAIDQFLQTMIFWSLCYFYLLERITAFFLDIRSGHWYFL